MGGEPRLAVKPPKGNGKAMVNTGGGVKFASESKLELVKVISTRTDISGAEESGLQRRDLKVQRPLSKRRSIFSYLSCSRSSSVTEPSQIIGSTSNEENMEKAEKSLKKAPSKLDLAALALDKNKSGRLQLSWFARGSVSENDAVSRRRIDSMISVDQNLMSPTTPKSSGPFSPTGQSSSDLLRSRSQLDRRYTRSYSVGSTVKGIFSRERVSLGFGQVDDTVELASLAGDPTFEESNREEIQSHVRDIIERFDARYAIAAGTSEALQEAIELLPFMHIQDRFTKLSVLRVLAAAVEKNIGFGQNAGKSRLGVEATIVDVFAEALNLCRAGDEIDTVVCDRVFDSAAKQAEGLQGSKGMKQAQSMIIKSLCALSHAIYSISCLHPSNIFNFTDMKRRLGSLKTLNKEDKFYVKMAMASLYNPSPAEGAVVRFIKDCIPDIGGLTTVGSSGLASPANLFVFRYHCSRLEHFVDFVAQGSYLGEEGGCGAVKEGLTSQQWLSQYVSDATTPWYATYRIFSHVIGFSYKNDVELGNAAEFLLPLLSNCSEPLLQMGVLTDLSRLALYSTNVDSATSALSFIVNATRDWKAVKGLSSRARNHGVSLLKEIILHCDDTRLKSAVEALEGDPFDEKAGDLLSLRQPWAGLIGHPRLLRAVQAEHDVVGFDPSSQDAVLARLKDHAARGTKLAYLQLATYVELEGSAHPWDLSSEPILQDVLRFIQGPARVFILQGGPGTGKSLFLRHVIHYCWKKSTCAAVYVRVIGDQSVGAACEDVMSTIFGGKSNAHLALSTLAGSKKQLLLLIDDYRVPPPEEILVNLKKEPPLSLSEGLSGVAISNMKVLVSTRDYVHGDVSSVRAELLGDGDDPRSDKDGESLPPSTLSSPSTPFTSMHPAPVPLRSRENRKSKVSAASMMSVADGSYGGVDIVASTWCVRRFILPFSVDQIHLFIAKFIKSALKKNSGSIDECISGLNEIPGLMDMAKTPQLLKALLVCLKELTSYRHSKSLGAPLTWDELFSVTSEAWFTETVRNMLLQVDRTIDIPAFHTRIFQACRALAMRLYVEKREFVPYEAKALSMQHAYDLRILFGKRSWCRVHAESGSPLRGYEKTDGTLMFGFAHRTTLEYYAAQALVHAIREKPASQQVELGSIHLCQTDTIMKFLVEFALHDDEMCSNLLDTVKHSAQARGIEAEVAVKAGANAVTILCASGFALSALDLSNVKLRKADMSRAILDNTSLKNADLSGCKMSHAWIHRTNFEGANMSQIDFGEQALVLLEKTSPIIDLFMAHSGKTVIACTVDTVWAIDVVSRDTQSVIKPKERSVAQGLKCQVSSVAIDLEEVLVFCGMDDGTIMALGITENATHADHLMLGHTDDVTDIAFHPSKKKLASVSKDATYRIWTIGADYKCSCTNVVEAHSKRISSVLYSEDGKRLMTSGWDLLVRIWDSESLQLLNTIRPGHTLPITQARVSKDGLRLVTSGYDTVSAVWSIESNDVLLSVLPHGGVVSHAAFSQNGVWVVTACWDKVVRLWHAETGRLLAVSNVHWGMVLKCEWTGGDKYVVSVCQDGSLHFWDPFETINDPIIERTRWVHNVVHSSDGDMVVSSHGGHIEIRKANSGRITQTLRCDETDASVSRGLYMTPQGDQVLAMYSDGNVRLWDIDKAAVIGVISANSYQGKKLKKGGLSKPEVGVTVVLCMEGSVVVLVRTKSVLTYDLKSLEAVNSIPVSDASSDSLAITCAASDGRNRVIMGSRSGSAFIYDIDGGYHLGTHHSHTGMVKAVAFQKCSKNELHVGSLSVSVGQDGRVVVWNPFGQSKEPRVVLDLGASKVNVISATFLEQGNILAVGASDGIVRLVNTDKSAVILETTVCRQPVFGISFSKSGQMATAAGPEGSVRAWNISRDKHSQKICDVRLMWQTKSYLLSRAIRAEGAKNLSTESALVLRQKQEMYNALQLHSSRIRSASRAHIDLGPHAPYMLETEPKPKCSVFCGADADDSDDDVVEVGGRDSVGI